MSPLRKHATTLVLVAAAVVATVVVVVWDRGSVSTQEAEKRKRNLFEAWRRDEVTSLRIEAAGAVTALTRRAGDGADGGWDLATSVAGAPAGPPESADPQAVDQYLGSLEFATADRRVEAAAVDRAAMGLDAPALAVEIAMGRLSYKLVLGGAAPTPPGARYAEVAGRGAFVVTKELVAALQPSADGFRIRTLIPYLSTQLAGLALDGEGGARHFQRAAWSGGRGAGWRWDGSTPEGTVRVESVAMDKLLGALGGVGVERFLREDEARAAFQERLVLTLVPKDAALPKGVLALGGPCPGKPDAVVAIRRAPTPLSTCVTRAALDALAVPSGDYVDRGAVGAALDEVNEVRLDAGERHIDLARAGAGWHMRAPDDKPIAAELGAAFVQQLLAVAGSAFLSGDPASLGLSPPRGTVRVVSPGAPVGGGGDRVEVIEIGAEAPPARAGERGIVAVRRLEDGAVLGVPGDLAEALLPSDLALRPHQLFDVGARKFRSLRVESAGFVQRVEREGEEAWKLVEPATTGSRADLGLVMDVAELVGHLAAERWVAGHAAATHGLSSPRVVVEAGVDDDSAPGGRRTLRLLLGNPTSGGSFGRVGDDRAVFVVGRPVELAATRLWLDRGALRVEPAEVSRVVVSAEGARKPLTVTRSGDVWRVEGEPDATAGTKAAAIRDALDDLTAEGAVSVGAAERAQGLDRPRLSLRIERTGKPPARITLGAGDSYRGGAVVYARRDGIEATFAVARSRVRPLFDAVGLVLD